MSTDTQVKQLNLTRITSENKTTRIVGKFNSKYKDVIKLAGLMKKKK